MRPKSVNILGVNYSIEYVDNPANCACGDEKGGLAKPSALNRARIVAEWKKQNGGE